MYNYIKYLYTNQCQELNILLKDSKSIYQFAEVLDG